MVEYPVALNRDVRRRSSGYSRQILLSKLVHRKILVLGSAGCGKRSLCSRFFDNEFEGFQSSDQLHFIYKNHNLILDVVTLANENPLLDEFSYHVETSDFIVIAYEIENALSAKIAFNLYTQLRNVREDKMPLVVVGTKLDLKKVNSPPAKFQQNEEIVRTIKEIKGAKHFLTSSKCNVGVYEAFDYGLNEVIRTIHTLSMYEYTMKRESFTNNKVQQKSHRHKFCFSFRLKSRKRRSSSL